MAGSQRDDAARGSRSGPTIPERIDRLHPYVPGKPIAEVERELGLSGSIKLASNENPLGPSPRVVEALGRILGDLHYYPEGHRPSLLDAIADDVGVDADRVVLGNGSNEILELVVRMFAGPDDEVLMSADGFLVYELVTRSVGARPVKVPAREHHHDLPEFAARLGPKTRVVFLANPNNPTGTIFTIPEWNEFIGLVPSNVVVVVDQAYVEYVTDPLYPKVVDQLDAFENVVVTRTFSKIHALAGLRIGYAIGSPKIIEALHKLRQPFNVNAAAQWAAEIALDDKAHMERSHLLAVEGRKRLTDGFSELGLTSVASQANFVLVEVGDGAGVSETLLREGVIVRPMNAYGLDSMIRVTVGLPEQNERCLAALAKALESA